MAALAAAKPIDPAPIAQTAATPTTTTHTTPAAPAIAPGTLVRASDRNNFGEIVSDTGTTCVVHFVSPEGQAADVELPKSQLFAQDGRRLDTADDSQEPPRWARELYDTPTFLGMDLRQRFLVRGVLAAGQPCVVGGRSKCLKTSIAVDLAVSLAAGRPFLGCFEVPEPVRVGVLSGESGAATIRETALRIAVSRGVDLSTLPITWGFSLPRLSIQSDLDAMAAVIQDHKLQVLFIDPLYLALLSTETAGGAGNVYMMGSILQPVSEMAQDAGVTLVVLHHFRKGAVPDDTEPCGLEELSQSGVVEWCRQWLLLARRLPYQNDGCHALWLRCGGSAGHAGFYGVDIAEGTLDPETFEGRTWDVKVRTVSDTKSEIRREKESRKAAEMERREGEHVDSLMLAIRNNPQGETEKALRTLSRLNTANFNLALHTLEQAGRIETCDVYKKKVRHGGWKPKN